MEGLKGTAIRLAVRDPSCPQAPVLPGARRHPAHGEGLLLRVAQATTTHTGTNSDFRGTGPACRLRPVRTGWCRDPDLIEGSCPLVYGTGSRHRPVRQILPISARASVPSWGKTWIWQAGPPSSTEGSAPWCGLAVTAICPLGVGAAAAVGRRRRSADRGGSPPGHARAPGTGPDGDAAPAPDGVPRAGRVQPGRDPGADPPADRTRLRSCAAAVGHPAAGRGHRRGLARAAAGGARR